MIFDNGKFLFSLVKPRNVGLVNLSWDFYSDEIVVRAELKCHWLYSQSVSIPGVCAEGIGYNVWFASSTAQESMLESLLTAQVYAGVSLLTPQLTKCAGVFYNPKGLVFWNGGESSARVIQSKPGGTKRGKCPIFSITRPQHVLPGWRRKRNSW